MATPGQLQMYNKLEVMEMFSLDDRARDKTGAIKRIHVVPDEKVPDACMFIIWIEDHTLGNMLRMELLRNDNVLFAGYKVPHPLDHMIEIRVQTLPKSSPEIAVRRAIANLKYEVKSLLEQFDEGVHRWKVANKQSFAPAPIQDVPTGGGGGGGGGKRKPRASADSSMEPLSGLETESAGTAERPMQDALDELDRIGGGVEYSPTYAGSQPGRSPRRSPADMDTET